MTAATYTKRADELQRGDVVLAINSDSRVPTVIVLRVREQGLDVWNLNTWRAESHMLPTGAVCTVEAPEDVLAPTPAELARALREVQNNPSQAGARWVSRILERARRTGILP